VVAGARARCTRRPDRSPHVRTPPAGRPPQLSFTEYVALIRAYLALINPYLGIPTVYLIVFYDHCWRAGASLNELTLTNDFYLRYTHLRPCS
jgi:hypothetical protein